MYCLLNKLNDYDDDDDEEDDGPKMVWKMGAQKMQDLTLTDQV